MAYVLGFFCADGNLVIGKRNNYYVEFTSTDKNLLVKIRGAMGSNNRIGGRKRNERWKTEHRLQIGSKTMVNDLVALGMTTRKGLRMELPPVPYKYFPHFVRGYFDGDGNVTCDYFKKSNRAYPSLTVSTRFTSGSKGFLEKLGERLADMLNIKGSLFYSTGWRLNYAGIASEKLFKFLYNPASKNLIYLKRKHKIYLRAKSLLRW